VFRRRAQSKRFHEWRKLVSFKMMEMSHTEIAPGGVVVTLAGKVMMGSESEKIVDLVDTLLRQGTRTIVFDMAGVTKIDSTGIGRFISSYNKIAAAGGEMRMAGATGILFQAFHVSLLDTVFRFYPDVETACKK
jgi:anti-sigma B factor antagonist